MQSERMTFPRLTFEFNPTKAASNLKKHAVSFDEAATVLDDPPSSTLPDDQHSGAEIRWITVGMSSAQRLLFAVYTETASRIRLIGACPVTAAEREQYERA